MIISIIKDKPKLVTNIAAILFWLAAWQIYSDMLGQEILMVSPVSVVKTLFALMMEPIFWQSVISSCIRILLGFWSGAVLGVVLAVLGYRFNIISALLNPVMFIMKSIPVASFILLMLFYISSRNLSVPASFVMVLPVIYINVLEGLRATDRRLVEMATVFRVSFIKKAIYIYSAQVMPYFVSACSLALGMSWKSGIAAEVIALPAVSIGERLFRAKTYLLTAELFAWTLVIVIISLVFEHALMALIKVAGKKAGGI